MVSGLGCGPLCVVLTLYSVVFLGVFANGLGRIKGVVLDRSPLIVTVGLYV